MPDAHSGDERAGFEVWVDKPRRVLKARMWGLWGLQVAEEFRSAMLKHGHALQGARWGILADTREFVAQPAAVTDIRKDVMQRVLPMGCKRVAALVQQAVHSMQFKRIAGEAHMEAGVFQDEDAALSWLSEERDASPV